VGVYFLMFVFPFFELHWAASVVFMSKPWPFFELVKQLGMPLLAGKVFTHKCDTGNLSALIQC